MRKKKWALLPCVFAVFFLFAGTLPVSAAEDEVRTVRVAYPRQEGLTDFDEFGKRTGYTYEYLEEIAQYTGWNYEFVDVDDDLDQDISTLMEMLENGEIDLMGGIVYSKELGELYDYTGHSYGTGETVLQVPYGSGGELVINSKIEQKIRVAVLSVTGSRIQELEDYCSMNLLTPEYVLCESTEEQIAAVEEGRADALLNSSMNYIGGVRTIARFAPRPFYFITTKGRNSGLMEELNTAMLSIEQANPHFASNLHEKYFASYNTELTLSEEEEAYLEKAGPLRVGVLENQPPYQYREEDLGEFRGISVDMLNYAAEKTGLSFTLVGASSQDELYRMASAGEIDLVAGMSYDYTLAREQGLSMSQSYASAGYILMMRENLDETSLKGKRLALVSTSTYKGETLGTVVSYPSINECVRAVMDGGADYTYVDLYTAQYYLNQPYYRNLKVVAQSYAPRRVCFGVVKTGDRNLLSILNKVVGVIPEMDLQGMVNQNLLRKSPLSLAEFLWQNPLESVLILSGISAAIIAVLFVFLWQRVRANRKTALELKKHYQVYALVNEYFFEYNFRSQELLVSIPAKDGQGKTELRKLGPQDMADPDGRKFIKFISSRKDGVEEMELNWGGGQRHWMKVALETVYDGDAPAYALGKIHMIDQEKQEKETLLELAQMDSLTRLYNAEASRSLIRGNLSRLKAGEYGGLILVDIDRFKSVNDTYGHLRGDETLKRLAELLRSSVRSGDIVGRPGGDEFAVYLSRVPGRETLEEKCALICEKVREAAGEDGFQFTVSMGAALAAAGESYEEVYSRADAAMYEAKRQGRDQYRIAPER